jgi:protein-tyrosine-phosphatase
LLEIEDPYGKDAGKMGEILDRLDDACLRFADDLKKQTPNDSQKR